MKCSRETEDLARKIVLYVLGGATAIAAIFTAIVFTEEFFLVLLILTAAVIFSMLLGWLMGEISFCRGDK